MTAPIEIPWWALWISFLGICWGIMALSDYCRLYAWNVYVGGYYEPEPPRERPSGPLMSDFHGPVTWTNLRDESPLKSSEQLIEELERTARETIHAVNSQREEILRAFVAKYGFQPDECQQVFRDGAWYVERREK